MGSHSCKLNAFSVLNNCFNEQQLNSLEDYMYTQASVILQFMNFEHNEIIIGTKVEA